jgi:hypothetical protein
MFSSTIPVCACGICTLLYFSQVFPSLQCSPHLHVFVLNSHAHIPTTWISFLASQTTFVLLHAS